MPSYFPPKKGVAYILYVGLASQANATAFQSTPTLAAGDFKVSIDGGALANLTTLPTVTPAAGKMVKISLSTSEMNGDNITIVCSDAAGAEWRDLIINLQTAARLVDDLAFPTTSGNSIDVTATGAVGIDWGNIENPNTSVGLGGTTVAATALANYLRLSTAQAGAAGTITLDASASAVDDYYKGTTIWITSSTGIGQARRIVSYVGSTKVATVQPNWGTNPSATSTFMILPDSHSMLTPNAIQAIWDALTSALTTAGSIGKLIVDNLNATITSRMATFTYTAPDNATITAINAKTTNLPAAPAAVSDIPTAATIATTVWDKLLTAITTAGSIGKLIKDNLDAAITTRMATFTYTAPDNADIVLIKAKTDNLPAAPAAVSDIPTAAVIADAVLDDAMTEPTAIFAWGTATPRKIIGWLGALARNKMTQTATTTVLRNDADSGDISTSGISDDGTTFTRNEWS